MSSFVIQGHKCVINQQQQHQQTSVRGAPTRVYFPGLWRHRQAPPPPRSRTPQLKTRSVCVITFRRAHNSCPRAVSKENVASERHVSTRDTREDMAQGTLVRKQQQMRQKQARANATSRWRRFKALRKKFCWRAGDVRCNGRRLPFAVGVSVFVCLSLIIKTGRNGGQTEQSRWKRPHTSVLWLGSPVE